MKRYLVFTTDLALAPLEGQNPRGGKLAEFDELDKAKKFAESEKEPWDRVFVFERSDNGELRRLEHYQRPSNGSGRSQKYVGNKRIREA